MQTKGLRLIEARHSWLPPAYPLAIPATLREFPAISPKDS